MAYASAEYTGDEFVFYESTITEKHAERLYEASYNLESRTPDVDLLSIAWIESRFKKGIKRGDNKKACGLWQMHARFSYPMFVRKSWSGWSEKKFKLSIQKECKRLEVVEYGAMQTKKYISYLKSKGKHLCHYNSGIKGKCSKKYRKKFDAIKEALQSARTICRY